MSAVDLMTSDTEFMPKPDTKPAMQWFTVIAVTENGKTVSVGSCPTRQAAESWAQMLKALSKPVGGEAFVEVGA